MTTTLQIKRTPTANKVPANGSLAQGELAIDMVTPKLYVGVPTSIQASGVQLVLDASVIAANTSGLATANGNISTLQTQQTALTATYSNADSTSGNASGSYLTPGSTWVCMQNGSKAMSPKTTGRLAFRYGFSGSYQTNPGQVYIGCMRSPSAFGTVWGAPGASAAFVGLLQPAFWLENFSAVGQMVCWFQDYLFGAVTTPYYYQAVFNVGSNSIQIYNAFLTVWEF